MHNCDLISSQRAIERTTNSETKHQQTTPSYNLVKAVLRARSLGCAQRHVASTTPRVRDTVGNVARVAQ